jgi:hypothetical protein
MDDTPYEFQEFPKWVTVGDAEPVLCEDAKAERKLKKAATTEETPTE